MKKIIPLLLCLLLFVGCSKAADIQEVPPEVKEEVTTDVSEESVVEETEVEESVVTRAFEVPEFKEDYVNDYTDSITEGTKQLIQFLSPDAEIGRQQYIMYVLVESFYDTTPDDVAQMIYESWTLGNDELGISLFVIAVDTLEVAVLDTSGYFTDKDIPELVDKHFTQVVTESGIDNAVKESFLEIYFPDFM